MGVSRRASSMAEHRMCGFKMSTGVVVAFCCAAIMVTLMALVVAGYLVDTYGHAGSLVAVLASLSEKRSACHHNKTNNARETPLGRVNRDFRGHCLASSRDMSRNSSRMGTTRP
jgi:hypothetical protein